MGPDRDSQILSLRKKVECFAKKYSRNARTLTYDDFMSAGWLGAIRAVDGFDPKREVKLTTYAEQKIRGAMLDLIESNRLFGTYDNHGIRVLIDKMRVEGDYPAIEAKADLTRLLESTTPKQREVVLKLLEGYSAAELSREYKIWPNGVRELQYRALKAMRAGL